MAKPKVPSTDTLSKTSSIISVKTVSKDSKKLMIIVVVLVIVGFVIYYYYATKWKPEQILSDYMKTFNKEYTNEYGDMFNDSDINQSTCKTFKNYKDIYANSTVETARKKVLNNKYSAQIYERYNLPQIDLSDSDCANDSKIIQKQLFKFHELFSRFFKNS